MLKLPTSDSAAFLCYFERKRLHQALQELMNNSIDVGSSAAVIKILDSFQQCHRCGVIGSFPACGNCKLVAYCSKECQRSDWKSHKLQCQKIAELTNSAGRIRKEILDSQGNFNVALFLRSFQGLIGFAVSFVWDLGHFLRNFPINICQSDLTAHTFERQVDMYMLSPFGS